MPEGVTASLKDGVLTVKGPLGENKKDFSEIRAEIRLSGSKVLAYSLGKRRDEKAIVNSVLSHVNNMIEGVIKGHIYRLKTVFAHFPVTVKVKEKEVHIENFYGERSPRVAKVVGNCSVKVEGDDITVTGASKEDVGQTSANIEQATVVRRRDQRVFLDGIYVYEKGVGKG